MALTNVTSVAWSGLTCIYSISRIGLLNDIHMIYTLAVHTYIYIYIYILYIIYIYTCHISFDTYLHVYTFVHILCMIWCVCNVLCIYVPVFCLLVLTICRRTYDTCINKGITSCVEGTMLECTYKYACIVGMSK